MTVPTEARTTDPRVDDPAIGLARRGWGRMRRAMRALKRTLGRTRRSTYRVLRSLLGWLRNGVRAVVRTWRQARRATYRLLQRQVGRLRNGTRAVVRSWRQARRGVYRLLQRLRGWMRNSTRWALRNTRQRGRSVYRRLLRLKTRLPGSMRRAARAPLRWKRATDRKLRRVLRPRLRLLATRVAKSPILGRYEFVQRFLARYSRSSGHILVHLQHRGGDIGRAQRIAEVWRPTAEQPLRLRDRVEEMHRVVQRGWPPLGPASGDRAGFNDRVLLALHNSLPYDHAGYAVRSQTILTHLQDHGIAVLATTRPGYPWDLNKHAEKPVTWRDEIAGIPYVRLPTTPQTAYGRVPDSRYIAHYAHCLVQQAGEQDATVIHAASSYLNGLAAAEAGRWLGIRSIYEVRGLWYMSRLAKEPEFADSDLYRYQRTMERAAMDAADDLVVLSGALLDLLLKWSIPREKIAVIPNAVDIEHFLPGPADTRLARELGVEGRTVVGFLGSLTEYEGLDLVLRAVSQLIEQGARLSLVVVGDGYVLQDLRSLARALPGGEHMQFTGRVPFSEVGRYYSVFDICPFPRKDYEVCRYVPPLKILETMAMEKAVIVSDLAPLKEMVADGETGLVCAANSVSSLRESLRNFYEDASGRQRMGRAARTWVEAERSWEKISRRYLQLYAKVG